MIEAFFFGPSNQQVFASYHPPVGGSGQVLTVICPPLFNEYMRTQLALRELAISLAERGQHVLRLDYRGTGDSFGDLDEVTLDSHRCIGCSMCLAACPFGAIWYDAGSKRIIKCDLCGGDPECIKWCFTEAIRFVGAQRDYDRLAVDKHADLFAQATQVQRQRRG